MSDETASLATGYGTGYGYCWCCAQHGIDTPAVSTAGLCRPCGGRSPSACQRAHAREAAR